MLVTGPSICRRQTNRDVPASTQIIRILLSQDLFRGLASAPRSRAGLRMLWYVSQYLYLQKILEGHFSADLVCDIIKAVLSK